MSRYTFPNVDTPRLVRRLHPWRVLELHCGLSLCVALTSRGSIVTWGCGDVGQLGSGATVDFEPYPRQVWPVRHAVPTALTPAHPDFYRQQVLDANAVATRATPLAIQDKAAGGRMQQQQQRQQPPTPATPAGGGVAPAGTPGSGGSPRKRGLARKPSEASMQAAFEHAIRSHFEQRAAEESSAAEAERRKREKLTHTPSRRRQQVASARRARDAVSKRKFKGLKAVAKLVMASNRVKKGLLQLSESHPAARVPVAGVLCAGCCVVCCVCVLLCLGVVVVRCCGGCGCERMTGCPVAHPMMSSPSLPPTHTHTHTHTHTRTHAHTHTHTHTQKTKR
mgnify:CR=1 FL=1